ncbi:MAG: YcgJ family protein [Cyanobacteria bacterium J06638_7]
MSSVHVRSGMPLLAAALAAALMPSPAAQARALPLASVTSPAPGVLCDRGTSVCYDPNGPSLALTRQHLGSWAEWRLARQLAGRPVPADFRLSDGSLCDLRSQTCWSDGFGRRQVSRELSERLFAQAHSAREVTRFEGLCNLVKGGRQLYDGPCSLRRVANSERGVNRYVVRQPDGSRYTFSERSGQLEVSDGERSWPASFGDHGHTGLFRWRDLTLVATREHSALPLGRAHSEGISQLFLDH